MRAWLSRRHRGGQISGTPTLQALLDDAVGVATKSDVHSSLAYDANHSSASVYTYTFKLMPRGFDAELQRLSEEGTT